jgi:hypothetical protein
MTAGLIDLEDSNGRHTIIDHGRFVEVRAPGSTTSLLRAERGDMTVNTDVPTSVQAAEEADLIWRWLSHEPLRLADATGELCLPRNRALRLERHGERAA